MAKVYDPAGVELFRVFDFEIGGLMPRGKRNNSHFSLYDFRPTQKGGAVVDFDTMSRQELKALQEAERAERVQMYAAIRRDAERTETPLEEYEGITPPVWNRPQPEGEKQQPLSLAELLAIDAILG